MLRNNIETDKAKLVFEKILAYNKNNSPDKKLFRKILKEGVTQFSAPYNISWEVTAACNLRCRHCCFSGQTYNPDEDLSRECALNLVNDFIEHDVIKVMLTGGEPLMRPDIFEIISLLKSHNIIIELTSNALLFTEDSAKRLGSLFNPLCDYIQVSIDGATPEVHEQTRGKNTFYKTIENIKLLIKNGINVTLNSVITSNNIHQMSELYRLASKLGVKKITFTRVFAEYDRGLLPDDNILFDQTVNLLKLENSTTKIDLKLFTIPELAACDAFKPFIPDLKKPKPVEKIICHQWEKLHIRKDGEVFLCLHSSNKNLFSLGNIKNRPFSKILENRSENLIFRKREIKNQKCNSCNFAPLCKSGCPINAWLKYNNINLPDPTCKIT